MAMTTAVSARDGTRQRLANPFLAIAMALGYLVGILGLAGLVMTTGTTAAQARGRGGRGGRGGFRGGYIRGGPFVYGYPLYDYGYYGYGGGYCESVSWRCSRYGAGYRRCMRRNGC